MKRGLVLRDPNEIADAEWEGRTATLQAAMRDERIDVALVYGDVFRSDDIGYLTNLCIYWNEGVVAVPLTGAPVLLSKLSPRVHTWMRRTSTVTDLRSGKTFGQLVATMLGEYPQGVVGLVDAGLWPASIVNDIAELIPGWEIRPLGSVVRDQRAFPSTAEIVLLRRGAGILAHAADEASAPGLSMTERVAALERDIRGGGFTDVMIDAVASGDGVISLQATGEFRHGWLRTSRLIATDGEPSWLPGLRAAFAAACHAAGPEVSIAELRAAAAAELSRLPADVTWELRCINQADLATNGELQSNRNDSSRAGEVVVISLDAQFPSNHRAVIADTLLVTPDGAQLLTATTQISEHNTPMESTR